MDLTWFDHFPEPVFYLQARRLQYCNTAALALEPDWTPGSPVPEELALEPDNEGVFSCSLRGRSYQASVTRAGTGLLIVLRHAVKLPADAPFGLLPIQLRELLNNIQTSAHMLSPMVREQGGDEARLHLATLYQNFYRLLRLVRHLEIARAVGREDFSLMEEQVLDLASFCREVSYSAAKLAEQAGVTMRASVPQGPISCTADRGLLEVMLLELISNAIKAAGKGGEAGISLAYTGKRVHITVWDNGPGMDQAALAAMMDGSSPESLPKPGTGLRLGLPIARYAAAAHGGALLLENRKDRGLRVTVSFPLRGPEIGKLSTPRPRVEESFPTLLTMLSDALPWQAFEE